MIIVLRLGHRKERDARISTHCGLVARALGADAIVYSGEKDEKMMNSIRKVVKKWGGKFSVSYESNWKNTIRKHKSFSIVHLTMYGLPVQKEIGKIRKRRDILVVIGGEKVPFDVYNKAHWNISVTNQPHSEVAGLAIFLDKYFSGKELDKKFAKAKIQLVPQEKGKMWLKR